MDLVLTCAALALATPPSEEEWQRIVLPLVSTLPESGEWVAVYEAGAGRTVDQTQVAYAWEERAWALVSGTGAMGRGGEG